MTNSSWIQYTRMGLLSGALVVALGSLAWTGLGKPGKENPPAKVKVDDRPINREGHPLTSFAPMVKAVSPSVVNIFTTTESKRTRIQGSPFMDDPLLRRFFGPNFRGGGPREYRTPRQQGLGSGVIVTEDGYLLTNNHVVDGADEIRVVLNSDKTEYIARVIGKDAKSDLAVLKIDGEGLPAATLGNSDELEVGDVVLALGNPFGVGQSVTMGIVSATGRASMGLNVDYANFIQTDAAINPGNSGGALIDGEGRLIGINTAILSRTGGNHGIGFAVPVNMARHVMDSLIEHGRVVRGFLGVNIQNVTADLARAFDLEENRGALIAEVVPDSPADKSGLESGDVVLDFNSKTIRDSHHLKMEVGKMAPGRTVPVTVLREGESRELEVTLGELPEKGLAQMNVDEPEDAESLKGVVVSDLDRDARSEIEAPRNLKGVLVTEVDPDSAAYEAGLRRGDVIREINQRPVRNAEDAIRLTTDLKDKKILLRVWSNKGGSRYLVVDEAQAG